ncbi:MAG TPA: RuvX/YqgF family protein [Candidatus Bathyarchaeia archaeon]|nr:RuvX/YqgF family protein [Candidatus Bathyarchaeia archaeon]
MSIHQSKKANISHILGVDFGKAKIGLAIADSETRIAFSYGVLKNDKDLTKNLKNIIEKEGIGKVIVGITDVETRLIASLQEKLDIPVEFQSEIFSTREAERNLIEKGAKKIKRLDDQEAARIILQSWLDKKG